MATDSKLLALNQALAIFQSGKEVDDVDISVKTAGARTVTYTVKSSDRETTRNNVEGSLEKFKVGRIFRKQMNVSSMEVTRCQMEDVLLTFVYKPTKGGMSQTTLNSSITELFPCIAFITGIRSNSVRGVQDFYNKIQNVNDASLSCYLNAKDAKAGKEFIDKAETGKFAEKTQNALNILRWVENVNKFHPITMVYW